jgi:uncharacterized protein YutE (UPF0331/DUF86 family)
MSVRADEDIVLAKVSTIRKCVAAIRSLPRDLPEPEREWMRVDLAVLNLQRAVEASIDLAGHLIAANGWELPRDAADGFRVLGSHGVVPAALTETLAKMVGFRNVAVHSYREIDPRIVHGIARDRLVDFESFVGAVLLATKGN